MGAVCCCLNDEDCEDYVNPNSSVYRNCLCLSCFVQQISVVYTSLFRRGEPQSISSSNHSPTSMTSTQSNGNSIFNMYHSPPRPLPYDGDSRYIRLVRDGLVSRREKGLIHVHEESEPLRTDFDMDSQSLSSVEKWNESACEHEFKKLQSSKSSAKLSSMVKSASGVGFVYMAKEDEDVCPTCLEEYTEENPKIMMKCLHHFHLGCIYEWMERSENCPVCGKVMAFDEST